MRKSQRLFLKPFQYDKDLVAAQMSQKFVEGTGFCGWREGAIIDPAEILETRPSQILSAVHEEHKAVLKRKLGSY